MAMQQNQRNEWLRWVVGLTLALLMNLGAWVYSYAQLTAQVQELQYEVRELRTVVLHNVEK